MYKLVIFGSLLSALCNRTSCAQVHELPLNHFGNEWDGILFSWEYIECAETDNETRGTFC